MLPCCRQSAAPAVAAERGRHRYPWRVSPAMAVVIGTCLSGFGDGGTTGCYAVYWEPRCYLSGIWAFKAAVLSGVKVVEPV